METLRLAGLNPDRVQRVIYVGGSSLMSMVSDTMKTQFHGAQHSFTEVFTAVADGLAIASARHLPIARFLMAENSLAA